MMNWEEWKRDNEWFHGNLIVLSYSLLVSSSLVHMSHVTQCVEH